MRTDILLMFGALLASCAPEIPQGVLECGGEPDGPSCPGGWFCHSNMRCYSKPELVPQPPEPATRDDAATSDAETREGGAETHEGGAGADNGDAGTVVRDVPPGAAPLPDPQTSLDASIDAGADASPGSASDAAPLSQEASVPVPTCASADSGIACDDGNFCNGVESCVPDAPTADARGCLAGAAISCPTGHSCSEQLDACTPCRDGVLDDSDGDGFESAECGGQDCDDKDLARHPGGRELCDGKDNDCDGAADGVASDAICAASAPVGGTSSCTAGSCVPRCSDPDYDLQGSACARHDDCAGVTSCGTGTCNDGVRSYSCTCPAGSSGTGTSACADVDECATGIHQCDTSPLATCMNTAGSYSCRCPENTTGVGLGPDGCVAPPPVECSTWVASGAAGVIPAGAPGYGRLNITGSGAHTQYICRLAAPDGTSIPGKVNSTPNNGASFEWGCYGAIYNGAAWVEYNAIQVGQQFEVFVPPASCRLDWATVPAGGAIPANALRMSVDAAGAALHSCMVSVNDASSQGTHMGRVGAGTGNVCVVQYFGSARSYTAFNVLVRL